MKLVADTNEIFSFFNPVSLARKIAIRDDVELHSPYFALEEIGNIKPIVLKRFAISGTQFDIALKLIRSAIVFHGEDSYSDMADEALRISPDPEDADFFALALKLGCPLWSEDKALKSQAVVDVYSSFELSRMMKWVL